MRENGSFVRTEDRTERGLEDVQIFILPFYLSYWKELNEETWLFWGVFLVWLSLYFSFKEDEHDLLVIFDELKFNDCEIVTWHDLLGLEELHLFGYLYVECGQTGKKLAHRSYVTCYALMD